MADMDDQRVSSQGESSNEMPMAKCLSESEVLLGPRNGVHEMVDTVRDMELRDYWRFSTVMGFCDILIDIDKYFIYMYLIQVIGCDFEAVYGVLALVYTVTYLLWSPAAGIISDLLENCILVAMTLCSAFLTLSYLSILLLKPTGLLLVLIYGLRCTFQIQLSSSTWKAIKMHVEVRLGSDPVLHEAAMNKIGTLGDLSTGALEVLLMATSMVSGVFLGNYELVREILTSAVLGISVAMLLLSIFLMQAHGPSLVDKNGHISGQCNRRDSITSIASTAQDKKEAALGIWKYFSERLTYFLNSVILTNCACLSMVSSCFEYMFDGPVTLTRATISTTHHGQCGGAVDFILMQALMLQTLYLIGGSLYFSFIMRMHPKIYYGRVFPATSALFMLATITPWLPVPEVAAAAVISSVTVVSYYMSIYNSYMLSGASRAEYFGFVQALYSMAVGVAGLVPSMLQIVQSGQEVLMVVAFVMATWGLLQSMHLWSRAFKDAVTEQE